MDRICFVLIHSCHIDNCLYGIFQYAEKYERGK